MRTVFIQLGRLGDIANILPMAYAKAQAGHEVFCYAHEDFASMLDGVSYVTPIVRGGLHRDIAGAIADAKDRGFDEIIETQVDGSARAFKSGASNFQMESWRRAGMEDQFHNLPLIFDNRDAEREASLKEWHLFQAKDRPVLAYALNGWSSPFVRRAEFAALNAKFSDQFYLIDLCRIQCKKPYDLLALIECATVLVATHTMHLVLANATGTPTIALGPAISPRHDRPVSWYWAEPRSHWIAKLDYDAAITAAGRNIVTTAIAQSAQYLCTPVQRQATRNRGDLQSLEPPTFAQGRP